MGWIAENKLIFFLSLLSFSLFVSTVTIAAQKYNALKTLEDLNKLSSTFTTIEKTYIGNNGENYDGKFVSIVNTAYQKNNALKSVENQINSLSTTFFTLTTENTDNGDGEDDGGGDEGDGGEGDRGEGDGGEGDEGIGDNGDGDGEGEADGNDDGDDDAGEGEGDGGEGAGGEGDRGEGDKDEGDGGEGESDGNHDGDDDGTGSDNGGGDGGDNDGSNDNIPVNVALEIRHLREQMNLVQEELKLLPLLRQDVQELRVILKGSNDGGNNDGSDSSNDRDSDGDNDWNDGGRDDEGNGDDNYRKKRNAYILKYHGVSDTGNDGDSENASDDMALEIRLLREQINLVHEELKLLPLLRQDVQELREILKGDNDGGNNDGNDDGNDVALEIRLLRGQMSLVQEELKLLPLLRQDVQEIRKILKGDNDSGTNDGNDGDNDRDSGDSDGDNDRNNRHDDDGGNDADNSENNEGVNGWDNASSRYPHPLVERRAKNLRRWRTVG